MWTGQGDDVSALPADWGSATLYLSLLCGVLSPSNEILRTHALGKYSVPDRRRLCCALLNLENLSFYLLIDNEERTEMKNEQKC